LGLFKEFLSSLFTILFNPQLNLFSSTPSDGSVVPSYTAAITSFAEGYESSVIFHFAGKILGKALWEGIVIDYPFAGFV
jgi:hypothetical protein